MGIYSNADIDSHGVPSNFSFLPALLKRRGYATHAIGKWHVGYRTEAQTPTRRGFDSFFGFWRCCSDYWLHGDKDGTIDQTNATAANGLVADRGHQGEYATQLYAREAARIFGPSCASRSSNSAHRWLSLSSCARSSARSGYR